MISQAANPLAPPYQHNDGWSQSMDFIQMPAVVRENHQIPAFGGATAVFKVENMVELVRDIEFY